MASFHFSRDTPPESVFTDIQSLNKFQDEQYKELISIVFTFLLEPNKSSRLFTQLDEFSEQHGMGASALKNVTKSVVSIPNKQHGMGASALKNVTKSVVSIPNSALRLNLSASQLKEDLIKLGLNEGRAEHFSEQYGSNLVGLSRTALDQTLMVNQLVDMEWKFGVTAASSEVGKVGNTFLQLKLVINKGNKTENVFMELTLPQFYSFLHEMEKAKTSLEYLS